jgi:preprotein translocase subunit SecG
MVQVLVVIHLLIAIVMIALILLQKNEGAAGAGFSAASSVASMNQVRARPNPLSRATTILGICFFATSLGLALVAKPRESASLLFAPQVDGPAVPKVDETGVPGVPTEAPAVAPSAAPSAANPAEPKAESSAPAVPAVPNN